MDSFYLMLNTYPSRIGLTQNDIDNFERRQNARQQSVLPPDPRASRVRLNANLPGSARPAVFSNINNLPPQQTTLLDTTDEGHQLTFTPPRDCSVTRSPLAVVWTSESDPAHPIPSHRSTPLLSSSRARRHHNHNVDFELFQESPARQQFIESRHQEWIDELEETGQRDLRYTQHAFPELVIVSEDPQTEVLDPGAPTFVPTTRFGQATAIVPHSGLTDDLSPFQVRVRSRSEQNLALINRGRRETPSVQAPNLDRYPPLRPVPNPSGYRSAQDSTITRVFQVRRATTTAEEADDQDVTTIRALTAAPSLSSRSSPNLLAATASGPVVGERHSSLTWNQQRQSADASHSSNLTQSSNDHLEHDVAEVEYMNFHLRQSPLDELRDTTSRMMAASVYPQMRRSTTARPLLAGQPFAVTPDDNAVSPRLLLGEQLENLAIDEVRDKETVRSGASVTAAITVDFSTIQSNVDSARESHETQQESDDPNDGRMQAVSSSPAVSTTNDMPVGVGCAIGSNAEHLPSPSTPSTMESSSPVALRSVPSGRAVPSRPVAMTPRIRVFDDRQPVSTQPRTPADLQLPRTRADSLAGRWQVEHIGEMGAPRTWNAMGDEARPAPDLLRPSDPLAASVADRQRRRRSIDVGSENSLDGHESGLERDRRI